MALDFACPDWWERLQDGRTPIADIEIDEAAADEAIGIFDFLHLPDVKGQPALETSVGDWMRDIVRAAFGAVRTSVSGLLERLVGEVFLLVPKKNSKTTGSAALAITFMLLNQRPQADMLIIGPTQKVADLAFEQAKGMIDADPEGYLQTRFLVQDHKKTILDRHNKSRLMIRTFGMDVLTGAKPIFCLIDELHILGSVPYAADVIRQIRGGMLPFPEALLIFITTQSDHPPAGVFKTELQYARGVRDGRITQAVRLLPVLYEFPEHVQTDRRQHWKDPAMWNIVTPNLGYSIDLERLKAGYQRALADGAGEIIAWASQHLNVEIGLALHVDRWIGADHWLAAGDDAITFEALLAQCEVVVGGIDGGGLDDLLALSFIGRHKLTKRWLHWAHAWAHPEVLERRKEISQKLLAFRDQGHLTLCETPTQDLEEVGDWVERVLASGLMPERHAIGLDPFGVAALVDELSARGLTAEQMCAVRQGSALSPAVWGLERKLKDKTFLHGAQDLMVWSVQNAVAEQRGNAVLITKQTAGKSKIDPLIATFNAVMLMIRNPEAQKRDLDQFLAAPVMAI